MLPCELLTLTGTLEDLHVTSLHYLDCELDHSADGIFQIPGFITLSVSPSNAFAVEHINLQNDTGSVFNFRVTRGESYRSYSQYYYNSASDHGAYALCTVTWTRTGLAFN